jgi:hypothetical protein
VGYHIDELDLSTKAEIYLKKSELITRYAMDGPSADRLRLVLKQSQMVHQMANDTVLLVPQREILWEGRSDTSDKWLTASVLYSHGQSHQVKFKKKKYLPSRTQLISHIQLPMSGLSLRWRSKRSLTIQFRAVHDACVVILY